MVGWVYAKNVVFGGANIINRKMVFSVRVWQKNMNSEQFF